MATGRELGGPTSAAVRLKMATSSLIKLGVLAPITVRISECFSRLFNISLLTLYRLREGAELQKPPVFLPELALLELCSSLSCIPAQMKKIHISLKTALLYHPWVT